MNVFERQLSWFLVQCKPREDGRALQHLTRQGYECYRPLYEEERLRHGRRHVTPVSLFPGYLFIRLNQTQDNWLPICSTRGVAQIVRFADYPVPVADEIIEEIRRRIDARASREPCLTAGERVMITAGSFSGLEAIFLANDGDERVMLLLNILQSDQKLSFPLGYVRKI